MTFRTKTIIGIASIEIVLLMILVFSSMSFLSDSNEKQLLQRADATASMFVHASTNAVLATDLATLDDLVNEIMALDDVVYVRISRFGEELAYGGDKTLRERQAKIDSNLKSIDDGVFDIRVNIEANGQVYGHVEMGFGTSAINQMLAQARQSIVGIATLEVFLVAIVSFIFGTYLTRNLVKLTTAAHTVAEKGPGYQINLNQRDELGELADAFDLMSRNLQQSYQELRQARIEAEDANESKSRFLASMSHEIRTPMNGVLGLLSLLEETELSRDQQKLLETATESGQFLLSIINDILDFSRMEANTLILERAPFNIKECVQSVVNSFDPLAIEKQLQLNCTIGDDIPNLVYGDPNRFRQILLNLLANAFKFTDDGSISVDVQPKLLKSGRCCIECAVSDTGVGIEQDAQSYLFDEFTMVDQSYSRTQEGSGLGLAICKRLAYLMDGEISVSSVVNKGSRFQFHVCFDTADNSPQQAALSAPVVQLPASLGACRVLVAEDNKANQLVIKNLFRHAGLDIDLAENGIQAVKMVEKSHYDIIFMDISMPQMDGIEACQRIRALEDENKSITPIIALTAHALSGDRENFLNIGMTDYLSKPVRKTQLIEKLTEHLNPLVSSAENPPLVNPSNENNTSLSPTAPIEKQVSITAPPESQPASDAAIMPESDLVDGTILSQMIEDTSVEVIPLLVEHYVEESNHRLEKIADALAQCDVEQLEFEAHTLGSSSLALGNRALSQLAREIEMHCINNQAEQAFELAQNLPPLAQASLSALIKYVHEGEEFIYTPNNS